MPKVRVFHESGDDYAWFWCAGCETNHRVPVTGPRAWAYNQNIEAPTFHPSIKVTWHKTKNEGTERVQDEHGQDVMHVCHSLVNDGRITYLGDCTHALAGQTVALEDIDNT